MKLFNHAKFRTNISPGQSLKRQCWIVSEKYTCDIESEWLKIFDDDDNGEPYGKGTHSNATLRSCSETHFVFDFYVDSQTRHHSIQLKLPKDKVKYWISIPDYHKYDYVFVEDSWHDHFWSGQLSTFLFVDAIGMKNLIDHHDKEILVKLDNLSDNIDQISTEYGENVVFVSASDNIIVKANFSTMSELPHYKPELLLDIYEKVSKAIKDHLNLSSYGIFTQGQNIYNSKSFSFSDNSKHINLRSLGAPFADIFAIDKIVQTNLKKGLHLSSSGYFERSFFYSLDLKHDYRANLHHFNFGNSGEYLVQDISEVISHIRE